MNTNCKSFQRSFQSASETDPSMREHLEECSDCTRYVRQIGAVGKMLRDLPRLTPPMSFEADVRAGIRARRGAALWSGFFRPDVSPLGRRYAWVATILVALGAGLVIQRYTAIQKAPPDQTAIARATADRLPDAPAAAASDRDEETSGPVSLPEPPIGGRQPVNRLAGAGASLRSQVPPAPAASAAMDGVTLLIRDEAGKELRIVKVPSMVVGAQLILSSNARYVSTDAEGVY